jgi:hypothetical protein
MRQYALPSRLSRYTNPRFIVTNVHDAFGSPRFLYETVYCQRGEMENRLKECQGDLFADRTPTSTSCRRRASGTMRANQLRLWLSSLAYVLMCAVRRIGLSERSAARRNAAARPDIRHHALRLSCHPGRRQTRGPGESRAKMGSQNVRLVPKKWLCVSDMMPD